MNTEELNKLLLENRKMRSALEYIEAWQLPRVDDRNGGQCSYESAYGSNGARDAIRQVARDALSSSFIELSMPKINA